MHSSTQRKQRLEISLEPSSTTTTHSSYVPHLFKSRLVVVRPVIHK